MAGAFKHSLRAVGIDSRLITDDLEIGYPLLESGIIQVRNAHLDGIIEPLEARFRFGGLPLQRRDVFAAALGLILAAAKDAAKQLLQTGGIERKRRRHRTCFQLDGLKFQG
ncbi:hypothetical protein, partial [uncultured Paracoccus sp.]|uniref:hypothetical protein n=1 Tax=uncultured Paracoccus sp. TaxID=189685 RepID=UPI0025936D73